MSILIAYNNQKERISIFEYDNEKVFCFEGHPLVAKRGKKNQWHFSHQNKSDDSSCPCSKEKGEWHCWHQNRIKKNHIEIYFEKGKHIADCVNKSGVVIEFQKSVIPKSTITEREDYYKNMIWVFCMDYHDFETIRINKNIAHIRLLKGSKYFLEANKPCYLDYSHKQTMMKVLSKKKNELLVQFIPLSKFDSDYLDGILNAKYDKRDSCLQEEYESASQKEIEETRKKWKI